MFVRETDGKMNRYDLRASGEEGLAVLAGTIRQRPSPTCDELAEGTQRICQLCVQQRRPCLR